MTEVFGKSNIIELAQCVAHRPLYYIHEYIGRILDRRKLSARWCDELHRLQDFIKSFSTAAGFQYAPLYKVFTRESGSKTYPAYGFSVPSVATCPGAGACRQYCYSARAWMYSNAVMRQLQNLLYMRFDPTPIVSALSKMKDGSLVRLYVDGDYRSTEDFFFWNNVATEFPALRFYSYTKSFAELKKFCEATTSAIQDGTYDFAPNTRINMSNGGCGDALIPEIFAKNYPCIRGIYVVVPFTETRTHKVSIETGERWLRENGFPEPYVYCQHHRCSECGFNCAADHNFTLWTPIR